MTDSFITYDTNQGGLGSPSLFPKSFDDMFQIFPEGEPETYNLLSSSQCPPENIQQNYPRETAFDVFSTHSAYSTNPSIKHSPEYAGSPEDQGAEDDQYMKPSRSSGVMKKGIRKQYEPIIDNNIVYRYEEDPSEYRKARKRIQNRESATRVRNRKKTHVEELEDEMDIIRKERAELKVHNASLIAENNMLKQQITFLERIVSRNGPEEMIDNSDAFPTDMRTETSDSMLQLINKTSPADSMLHLMNKTSPSDSILQFINKSDEEIETVQPGCKYFRAAPTHQFKKQVAMLGVFTLLLCVYGLLPRSEPIVVQLFSKNYGSAKTNLFSVKNTDKTSDDGLVTFQPSVTGLGKWMMEWSIEIVVIISYIVCLFCVGVKAFRHHRKEKKTDRMITPL